MCNKNENIPCVILAGGRGSRLDGKGKYAQKLLDISLLEHVFNRIKIQTDNIAINFKRPLTRKFDLKAEIIYDAYDDDIGPLAGIHGALKYAYKKHGPNGLVCTVPVDTPFLPKNLISKLLLNSKSNIDIVTCNSNDRKHPTIALWKTSLLSEIEKSIKKKIRKIDLFTNKFCIKSVVWDNIRYDPFFNINNHEDLKIAENMLKNRLII